MGAVARSMVAATGVGVVVGVQAGMGMVPCTCTVVSELSALVGAQHRIVVVETDTTVESETDVVPVMVGVVGEVVEVHLGMSPEMVGVVGVGTKTVASIVHEWI